MKQWKKAPESQEQSRQSRVAVAELFSPPRFHMATRCTPSFRMSFPNIRTPWMLKEDSIPPPWSCLGIGELRTGPVLSPVGQVAPVPTGSAWTDSGCATLQGGCTGGLRQTTWTEQSYQFLGPSYPKDPHPALYESSTPQTHGPWPPCAYGLQA